MSKDIVTITAHVLSLDAESRAYILDELSASLADTDPFFEEQLNEAERRWQSIESGEAKIYPMDDVIQEARNLIRR
jgi:hypothetical protein